MKDSKKMLPPGKISTADSKKNTRNFKNMLKEKSNCKFISMKLA